MVIPSGYQGNERESPLVEYYKTRDYKRDFHQPDRMHRCVLLIITEVGILGLQANQNKEDLRGNN